MAGFFFVGSQISEIFGGYRSLGYEIEDNQSKCTVAFLFTWCEIGPKIAFRRIFLNQPLASFTSLF